MHILISVPYENAEKMIPIWAEEEGKINFRTESLEAARCTASFAAMELGRFLHRTLIDVSVSLGSERSSEADLLIELRIQDPAGRSDGFSIEPFDRGVTVVGKGRTGLLYGAYELLRLQGWRWYSPGKQGEIAPEKRDRLFLPEDRLDRNPSMDLGRGFDFGQYRSKDSVELLLWMARNRLNVASYRSASGAFANKLGMLFKNGGHVFEKFLDPDRMLPSGKTLWEEHQDWYGLPPSGNRIKEEALRVQFCVSQEDLIEYLCAELLGLLMGDWRQTDRLDLWGFDTWGKTCGCDRCVSIGNSTDQNLYFGAKVRSFMNAARADGRLDRDVQLVLCSYEGTCTIDPPTQPYPAELAAAGDLVVYYPIRRCYAHDMQDSKCEINKFYSDALSGWTASPGEPALVIGEYYNVSKFEDLPLILSERIAHDIPWYHALGVRSATYMHVPFVNWGPRALTQYLYAELTWDAHADAEALMSAYFAGRYGAFAGAMRSVYELVERAFADCTDFRAWGPRSVLSHLLTWDGGKPPSDLPLDNHFKSMSGAADAGRRSVDLLKQAMEILTETRKTARDDAARNKPIRTGVSVNPAEAAANESASLQETAIGEDWRSVRYGLDTMVAMTEVAAYYTAQARSDERGAEEAWKRIQAAEDALDSYYVPVDFEHPGPGIISRDALTRSQLRDVIARCRRARLTEKRPRT